MAFFSGIWETITNVVQTGIMLIGSILSAAFDIITLPFRFIWENCKEIISKETMSSLAEEITGKRTLLGFSENVIKNDELNRYLHSLHQTIMDGSKEFEKEEMLLLLISLLIEQYGQPFSNCIPECSKKIEDTCIFMEEHFSEHITLEELCKCSGLSKSTLLRAFTKSKGVTPYRYLQAIRVGKAKALLEQGVFPIDAAIQTGFSDQSHFSNFFNMFIGLSPAAYRRIFKEGGKSNE